MSTKQVATRFRTYGELADLVHAFEKTTLPQSKWHHPAHLAVAAWYLVHHDEQEAVRRMTCGIQRYNHAVGISPSPRGGYHETLTIFWLTVVRAYQSARAAMVSGVEVPDWTCRKYSSSGTSSEISPGLSPVPS